MVLQASRRPRRVVVLLGLVSIGALAALAVVAIQFSSDSASEQARRQVAAAAAATSIAVEQEMRGMTALVASVASRPSLVAALGSGTGTSVDRAVVDFSLASLQQVSPGSGSAFVTDPNGRLIDAVPATSATVGEDLSSRDWYRGVTETERPYVSEAYQSAGGGVVVGVAAPIRATSDPTGPVIGFLVAGYRVDSIQQLVNDSAGVQGVLIRVVDQKGSQVVVAPGKAPTGLLPRTHDPQVAAALDGVSGTSELRRGGTAYFAAHVPLNHLGWAVIAELPERQALSTWGGIVIAAAVLGLVVLGSLLSLDRTLRRRITVEVELRRSQAFLDSVIENIPTTVFVKDANDLRFVRINRAGEQLFGLRRDEMLGRSDFDLFPPDDAARFAARDREVIERGELMDIPSEQFQTRDGDQRLLHARKIPIFDPRGCPEYLLGIAHDVTEQHQAKEAIDAARRASDSANAAKNEFLSRMSHELRTPLNAVLGFGQLLQLGGMTDAQRSNVDHIMSAGRHLLALVDDVLDLARVESGELRMSVGPVSAADAVDRAVNMMRPLAGARGIDIIVDTVGCDQAHVRADRQRLQQVLVNLLANAVKYNRDRGEIRISAEAVDDGRLRLTVTDTGIGIAVHDLDRLFAPFERIGAEHTPIEGTGLGLTVAKQLVDAMAGEIGVTSTVGVGTSFWVELPKVPVPADTGEVVRDIVVSAPGPGTGAPMILYIEDNISNVTLVERIVMTRPDATLMVAMLGSVGLDLAHVHLPTLILLDLHLPDMPGEEVLRRLRSDERTADIPIFVLTADATSGQVQRVLEAGATGYMTKPFDIPRLLALIDGSVSPGAEPADRTPSPVPMSLEPTTIAALHELAALSADGPDQMRQLVELFLHDAAARLTELTAAAGDGDGQRIVAIAHSLAGSSANLGARELADGCSELEREARAGRIGLAAEQLLALVACFGDVQTALCAEFPGTPQPASR